MVFQEGELLLGRSLLLEEIWLELCSEQGQKELSVWMDTQTDGQCQNNIPSTHRQGITNLELCHLVSWLYKTFQPIPTQ